MTVVEERVRQEAEILKVLKREILKSAKKGEFHYYWETAELSNSIIKSITKILESEGKMVNSKGHNYKVVRW